MNNRYISRYSKYDTHFHRRDPFPYATWDDELKAKRRQDIAAEVLGFVALVAALVWLAFL